MFEFPQYKLGFLAYRDLSKVSFLAIIDTRSGAQFLTISIKIFIKSQKSTGVDEPRPDVGKLEIGKPKFKPVLLGAALS